MDTIMVKGRGEHRGMYLSRYYPPKGGPYGKTRWVQGQRNASKWDMKGARQEAAEANGYPVRLIAPRAVTARVAELKAFIHKHAARAEDELPCHWVHGANEINGIGCDEGTNFCHDCCEAMVEKIRASHPKEAEDVGLCVDGGWTTDHDSTPFCETCGARLQHTLTDYGADEELAVLTDDLAPAFDDPDGWLAMAAAVENLRRDDPRWRAISRVIDAAKDAEARHIAHLAELAAAPGMTEARTSLLALLQARMVQKRAEPSYRHWAELQRYRALPFEKTYKPSKRVAAWEKRLWKEARSFLALFGYHFRGDYVAAPYGEYHWGFVVELEQHRLWQSPAYLEGHAYALHPCPSGDPKWTHSRDANPHPKESAEHTAWDCGYIFGLHEKKGARDDYAI